MKRIFQNSKIPCVVLSLFIASLILIPVTMTSGKYTKSYSDTVTATIPGSESASTADEPAAEEAPGIEEGVVPNTVYQVQPGDTLSAIAKKFHIEVEKLAEYNGIDITDSLQPGAILRLPQ